MQAAQFSTSVATAVNVSSTATASNPPSALVSRDIIHDEFDEFDESDDDDDDDDGDDNRDDDESDDFDNTSLYEEILNGEMPYKYRPGPNVCTPEEAEILRRRLRDIGIPAFVRETLSTDAYSAKKLCSAFRVSIPPFLEDASDEACYQLLGLVLMREQQRRLRLPQYQTIDDAARLLQTSKNIMVITGAGISTSLGIPDFRSKKSGFYNKLSAMGFQEPEEVFDLHNFDSDPSIFYSLAADILPQPDKWTPTHQFIRLLQDRGKLLRNYTQNIDNIESHAGITAEKMIQCHGSWAFATCRKCSHKIPGKEIFAAVRAKKVARCNSCKIRLQSSIRPGPLKRKRSSNGILKSKKRGDEDSDSEGQYDIPEPGVMKPDITFFGEHLPDKFFDALQNHDRNKVDLVIVIGTSMKVAPVSEIPQYVDKEIPQIYISLDPIHHIDFDINLIGDCDTVVTALCRRAGWDLKHEMVDKSAAISVTLHPHFEHAFVVEAECIPPVPSIW